MSNIELLIIAVGASLDATAVAICQGLSIKNMNYKHSLLIAFFFGLFQAMMPLIGYLLGTQFDKYLQAYDHYIAFILLSIIGLKLIFDSNEACPVVHEVSIKKLTVLAFATSIDALAIGVTFAFLQVDLVKSITIIGVVTFILSYVGTKIGKYVGNKLHSQAEILGGIILILIGTKILLEHLGVINF